jgi:hypothetical protein
MNLQPILNKKLPRAHLELELGMLGVTKYVKNAIHFYQNKIGKICFSSYKLPKKPIIKKVISKYFRG